VGDGDTGTVITVPAAFNQMQKDSTMAAADAAGLGRVALMQEPVAAVMSVMRQRKNDGVFVVYDLGGGTLDIAIAESISGRVNLLASWRHCHVWRARFRPHPVRQRRQAVAAGELRSSRRPGHESAVQITAAHGYVGAEKAKIELSQKEEAVVSLPETELGVRDQAGEEIYIDIAVDRQTLRRADRIGKIEESIQSPAKP
jgi:molecular chaperone DnaK